MKFDGLDFIVNTYNMSISDILTKAFELEETISVQLKQYISGLLDQQLEDYFASNEPPHTPVWNKHKACEALKKRCYGEQIKKSMDWDRFSDSIDISILSLLAKGPATLAEVKKSFYGRESYVIPSLSFLMSKDLVYTVNGLYILSGARSLDEYKINEIIRILMENEYNLSDGYAYYSKKDVSETVREIAVSIVRRTKHL